MYKWFVQFSVKNDYFCDTLICNKIIDTLVCNKITRLFVETVIKYNYYIRVMHSEDGDECGYKYMLVGSTSDLSELRSKWEGTIEYIYNNEQYFICCEFYEYDNNLKFEKEDLLIRSYKISGATGQVINGTLSSTISITHLPTNITIFCDANKSCIENIEIGKRILNAKVSKYYKTKISSNFNINKDNIVLTFKE